MPRYVNKLWLLCLLLPMLTACSFFYERFVQPLDLMLLPPMQGPEAGVTKRKVTLDSAGKQQSFMVLNQFSETDFQVIVLMATGQRILSMHYDGQQFQQTNYTDIDLPGREIMAVMQFALWPEEAVSHAYQSVAKVISTERSRQLRHHGEVALEAFIQEDGMMIKHYLHHYSVTIEPLSEAK